MSKRVGVGLLSIIFLVALVSAMPVEAKTPIRWDISAMFVGNATWLGEIIGEDATAGIFSSEIVFLSNGQKMVSEWWIDFIDGGYIKGTAHGFFVYETNSNILDGGKYVLNGKVTFTSPDWSHLNGRNVHVMGIITPFPFFTEATIQIN
ncbi:MAG: hypothetical protein ACFFAD_00165 [Candidatus Hermodarchaeota archaeon]